MVKNISLVVLGLLVCSVAIADYDYVNSYYTNDGEYRSGHYRDTSNDGYSYNNANTLGYNDNSRSRANIAGYNSSGPKANFGDYE